MVHPYEGHYTYNENVVKNWKSTAIGIYYCGFLTTENKLHPLYIGIGTGDEGIKGRLLDHIRDDNWPDVTHFDYQICDTIKEAENWEIEEIQRYQPKYNEQNK